MRLLLIDTCGDAGSLALAQEDAILRRRILPPRTSSARFISDLRDELGALEWSVRSLDGVGIVNGPGSFTGVRVGMAAAKGLCEVAGMPLAAVSRLELLLSAGHAMAGDIAVLDAGRGEFYTRCAEDGEELLIGRDELLERSAEGRLLMAEDKLMSAFESYRATLVELSAADALPLAVQRLIQGGTPVDFVDANYVRQARGLYAPPQVSACSPGVR